MPCSEFWMAMEDMYSPLAEDAILKELRSLAFYESGHLCT